jgi:hypothetical protein
MASRPLPDAVLKRVGEEQPLPQNRTKELNYLLDASFVARPLSIPGIGQIGIKNTEYSYYWVRLKRGNNPDMTRYMQMKAAGYENATIDDVDPKVNSVAADKNEVTCGVDLILMKAKPEVHYGALKFHQMRAIEMTNPRSTESVTRMMRSLDFDSQASLQESRTYIPGASEVSERESRATPETAVRQGTPQWKEIAEATQKKGGK